MLRIVLKLQRSIGDKQIGSRLGNRFETTFKCGQGKQTLFLEFSNYAKGELIGRAADNRDVETPDIRPNQSSTLG